MSAWDAMTGMNGTIRSWSKPLSPSKAKPRAPQTSKRSLASRQEMSTYRRGVAVTLPTLEHVRAFRQAVLSGGEESSAQ